MPRTLALPWLSLLRYPPRRTPVPALPRRADRVVVSSNLPYGRMLTPGKIAHSMIRAAIVGIGTWGRNLVEATQESEVINFVAGATGTPAKAESFCKQHGIHLMESYAELLAYAELDAVVLA